MIRILHFSRTVVAAFALAIPAFAGTIGFDSADSEPLAWNSGPYVPAGLVEGIDFSNAASAWQLAFVEDDSPIEETLAGLPTVFGPYALPEYRFPFIISSELGGPEFSMTEYEKAYAEFVRVSNLRYMTPPAQPVAEVVPVVSQSSSHEPQAPQMAAALSDAPLNSIVLSAVTANPMAAAIVVSDDQPAPSGFSVGAPPFGDSPAALPDEVPEINSLVAVLIGGGLLGIGRLRRRSSRSA